MTFTELVSEASNRLNLTSSESTVRIGSYVNQRYRRLTSSLGINTSRRSTITVPTVNGQEQYDVALENIEFSYSMASGHRRQIFKLPYATLRQRNTETPQTGDVRHYAIYSQDSDSITIAVNPIPTAAYDMIFEGLVSASTLSGTDVPAFPADFHDILVLGAMSDELFKMEKYPLAKDFQAQYDERASDLRMFLAKGNFGPEDTANNGGLVPVTFKRWGA